MTTQLEMFERRQGHELKITKEMRSQQRKRIQDLKKIGILFRICGDLWDVQAKRLEKDL